MLVYKIIFPDDSVYIGCTKHFVELRINNHISKCKSKKYNRPVYKKMLEFDYNFKHKVIGYYKNEKAMYKAEEMFIAFNEKSKILNISTGGIAPAKGRKGNADLSARMSASNTKNNRKFMVIDAVNGETLYIGRNQVECSKVIGCTSANVSYSLKNIDKTRKRKISLKYVFSYVTGVGYSNKF